MYVERLLCKDIDETEVKKLDELNFYKKQNRIALSNCGKIDPENASIWLYVTPLTRFGVFLL